MQGLKSGVQVQGVNGGLVGHRWTMAPNPESILGLSLVIDSTIDSIVHCYK